MRITIKEQLILICMQFIGNLFENDNKKQTIENNYFANIHLILKRPVGSNLSIMFFFINYKSESYLLQGLLS